MPAVLLSMFMGACFLIAGLMHKQRGEQWHANRCAVMVGVSLGLLGVSIATAI